MKASEWKFAMNTILTPVEQTTNGMPSVHQVDPYADSERSFEIVRGRVVEKQLGLFENFIASTLYYRLTQYCENQPLGWTVIETPFVIPGSGNHRKPDVAFVSYGTWPSSRPIPRLNAWFVAPDLAVEVISPNDKAFDVLEKVHEYFAAGVRQVWQIYSQVEQVWIYESPTSIRVLTRADEQMN